MTEKTKDRINDLEQPRREIVKFLRKKGWSIALVGDMKITGNMDNMGTGKYWFIMEFLGGRKK